MSQGPSLNLSFDGDLSNSRCCTGNSRDTGVNQLAQAASLAKILDEMDERLGRLEAFAEEQAASKLEQG